MRRRDRKAASREVAAERAIPLVVTIPPNKNSSTRSRSNSGGAAGRRVRADAKRATLTKLNEDKTAERASHRDQPEGDLHGLAHSPRKHSACSPWKPTANLGKRLDHSPKGSHLRPRGQKGTDAHCFARFTRPRPPRPGPRHRQGEGLPRHSTKGVDEDDVRVATPGPPAAAPGLPPAARASTWRRPQPHCQRREWRAIGANASRLADPVKGIPPRSAIVRPTGSSVRVEPPPSHIASRCSRVRKTGRSTPPGTLPATIKTPRTSTSTRRQGDYRIRSAQGGRVGTRLEPRREGPGKYR